METVDNERFQEYVVNRMIPFPKMLEQAGYEGYSYEGKCFCVFHDNENTPSAKLYHDKTGDTLWCFSEQKRYYPSDVLKRKLMKGKTVSSIFSRLWPRLSEETQSKLIDDFGAPVDFTPQAWKDNQEELKLFFQGKKSFSEHLMLLEESLRR